MGAENIRSEIWQVALPLRHPVRTPIGEIRALDTLVVRLFDPSGAEGSGYAIAFDAPLEQLAHGAQAQLGRRQLQDLLRVERTVEDGGDQALRKAVAAISLAAWDLAGRRAGKACADLWGKQRSSLPLYASALFLDRSMDELVEEAKAHRRNAYPSVKMRGAGNAPAQDAARFHAVCGVYPADKVAIDFVCRSDASRTRDFLSALEAEPMWVEDPVPYELARRLERSAVFAAGERCTSMEELLQLRDAGIPKLILDVEYLGGPLRFLEAARALQPLGCEVGSHMYVHESVHLLAALPVSMPVEWLDWCDTLYNERPMPDSGGQAAVRGPGFGRTLRMDTLERHGRRVA